MAITQPTFQPITIPTPVPQPLSIDPLPSFTDPASFTLPSISYQNIPLPISLINNFYTPLFYAVITNTIDTLAQYITNTFQNIDNKLNYQFGLLARKYGSSIVKTSDIFGFKSSNAIHGRFVKNIYTLHTDELLERQDITLKIVREEFERFSRTIREFYEKVFRAHDLYADIYEKDFNASVEIYNEWITTLIAEYNTKLQEAQLNMENERLKLQTFNEKVVNTLRQFEYIKEVLQNLQLKQEEQVLINEFLTAESNYFLELERFNYLGYEALKYQNKLYQAQLRKAKAEIEKIDTLARYIREKVNLYLQYLEGKETEIRTKKAILDNYEAQISTERTKLDLYEDELRILFELEKLDNEIKKLKDKLTISRKETELEKEFYCKLEKFIHEIFGIQNTYNSIVQPCEGFGSGGWGGGGFISFATTSQNTRQDLIPISLFTYNFNINTSQSGWFSFGNSINFNYSRQGKEIKKGLKNYIEQKMRLLDYLFDYKIKEIEALKDIEGKTKEMVSSANSEINKINAWRSSLSVFFPAYIEYRKTFAISNANITAKFIRSYA